jgi:hypothetical protein
MPNQPPGPKTERGGGKGKENEHRLRRQVCPLCEPSPDMRDADQSKNRAGGDQICFHGDGVSLRNRPLGRRRPSGRSLATAAYDNGGFFHPPIFPGVSHLSTVISSNLLFGTPHVRQFLAKRVQTFGNLSAQQRFWQPERLVNYRHSPAANPELEFPRNPVAGELPSDAIVSDFVITLQATTRE